MVTYESSLLPLHLGWDSTAPMFEKLFTGVHHMTLSPMFKKQEEVAEIDFCHVLCSSIVIQTREHRHHS